MSAILPALASIAGNVINSGANIYLNKQNNQANKELAELGYQRELEMWQKNNLYNSPEAQMARLKQAGLNPNLVYGTGTVTGNTSQQLPKYNAPRMEAPSVNFGIAEGIQAYQQARLNSAQVSNIETDTKVKAADAILRVAQTAATSAQASKTNQEFEQNRALMKYSLDAAKLGVDKLANEVQISNYDALKGAEGLNLIKSQIRGSDLGNRLTEKQIDEKAWQIYNYSIYGTPQAPQAMGMPLGWVRNTVSAVGTSIKNSWKSLWK